MNRRFKLTTLALIFSISLFEMATDIYIPCLPEIMETFNTSEAYVQHTLSIYLLGFSLVGTLSGPLSDSLGRRPIFICGILLFTLGTVLCMLASSIETLIYARFLQGLGAGSSFVLGAPILKDLYDEKSMSRVFSLMGMIVTLSPMIAPMLGAFISTIWDWHMNFIVMTLLAVLAASFILFGLKETLPITERKPFLASSIFKTYLQLITTKRVICYILISGITYGSLWAWIPEAPFYLIEKLGVSKTHYAYYAAIGPAAYILGTLINQKFVIAYGTQNMLKFGLMIVLTGTTCLLLATSLFPKNLILIFGSFSIWCIGMAPLFANATAKSVNVLSNSRGSASALLNASEALLASATAYLISTVTNGTLVPPAIVILCGSLISCGLYYFFLSKEEALQQA